MLVSQRVKLLSLRSLIDKTTEHLERSVHADIQTFAPTHTLPRPSGGVLACILIRTAGPLLSPSQSLIYQGILTNVRLLALVTAA